MSKVVDILFNSRTVVKEFYPESLKPFKYYIDTDPEELARMLLVRFSIEEVSTCLRTSDKESSRFKECKRRG